MIEVKGSTVRLSGTNELLEKELAFLLGVIRSRIASQGNRDHVAAGLIYGAVEASACIELDKLRSEARICFDAWRMNDVLRNS